MEVYNQHILKLWMYLKGFLLQIIPFIQIIFYRVEKTYPQMIKFSNLSVCILKTTQSQLEPYCAKSYPNCQPWCYQRNELAKAPAIFRTRKKISNIYNRVKHVVTFVYTSIFFHFLKLSQFLRSTLKAIIFGDSLFEIVS